MEIFDKRLNLIGLIIVPIATVSAFKIFGIPYIQKAIIMIVLIGMTMIAGFITKLKILIPKEYSKVKGYLDEMKEDKK